MLPKALGLALFVALVMPAVGLPLGGTETASPVMQASPDDAIWTALRSLGHSPAQWAVLLTSDADGNRQTDFLDLVAATHRSVGAGPRQVELLVRGSPEGVAAATRLLESPVAIADADAVFGVFSVDRLPELRRPGIDLVIWEPRAHLSSQNPAGGTPANMLQIAIHQGGGAWTGSPSYTGSGVTIAILDTGADTGHQALDGGKVSKWKDCTSTATTAYDNHGHGTHVASIAAGDDGTDFRGIAYQASVNAVKVLDGAGSGSLAMFQCGITWVRQGGTSGAKTADVASMSAGLGVPPLGITTLNGGPTDLFGWDGVAAQLSTKKIPFAVAAGNWAYVDELYGVDETTQVGVNGVNQVSSPGFSTSVITVGAVDVYSSPAAFTALGPGATGGIKPDVAAMGVDTWGALVGTTSWYGQWDGTSMATPLVGGALAMLYQKNAGQASAFYYNAVRNGAVQACFLGGSTTGPCDVSEVRDPNFVVGHGVLKAQNSLALV